MKNKLKFLIKMSLKKKIGTKWFKAINIILAIVIVGVINLDSIISFFGGDFKKETTIHVIDNSKSNSYNIFEQTFNNTKNIIGNSDYFKVQLSDKTEKEITKKIKNNKEILIVVNENIDNYLDAKIISNSYIEPVLYQVIVSSLNTTKASIAYSKSNIDMEELAKINAPISVSREFLDEQKSQSEENMNTIMSVVFPIVILPFFMLVVFLVQMIGAEINEEKTTRGMEIIISNVSPRTHFFSKVIASNLFVILQGILLFIYGAIGFIVRNNVSENSFSSSLESIGFNIKDILNNLVESGFIDKLLYIIPLTIILFLLSFLAYSLLAGILASMTTNMEDYQQIQAPIMIICLAGYYLSIMAALFEGSIFIKVASYIPFISALLAPPLLAIGQIGIIDILISISILALFNFIMIKYGLKIYKIGILNYSATKVWSRIFKAARE